MKRRAHEWLISGGERDGQIVQCDNLPRPFKNKRRWSLWAWLDRIDDCDDAADRGILGVSLIMAAARGWL